MPFSEAVGRVGVSAVSEFCDGQSEMRRVEVRRGERLVDYVSDSINSK
jgi:hypothetical protein